MALSRFLDWLDESAAGVIRIAYLLAGVIAVASYFSDGNVPAGFAHVLNSGLPWVLAGALEIHTYLTARRVRQAWQDSNAAALGSDEHDRSVKQMKLNLGILAALLAFSMYNQLQYLAQTWTPPHLPLTPPGPWPYIIRAVITPAAFMAAAFLAPMGEGMAVQIQSEAHYLTAAAFKAASAQWKRRLREMQRTGQDITSALVELVDDPAERRVIATIHRAMHGGSVALSSVTTDELPSSLVQQESSALLRTVPAGTGGQVYKTIELVSEETPHTPQRPQGPQGPGMTRHTTRTTRTRRRDSGRSSLEKEMRIQRLVELLRKDPKMSLTQIMEALDVLKPTAVTDRQEAKRRLAEEKTV